MIRSHLGTGQSLQGTKEGDGRAYEGGTSVQGNTYARSEGKMGARGTTRQGINRSAALIALLVVAIAWPGQALGAQTRDFTGSSIGPEGTASLAEFADVQGVAVDPSSGTLYVLDAGAGKLYKFDSSGSPSNFASSGTNFVGGIASAGHGENQLAVAPPGAMSGTAGDIYVATYPGITIYAPSGALLGSLTAGAFCGVSTDSAGHVFASSYPEQVLEFSPTTNPVNNADISGISSASLNSVCNVAADGTGSIYATNFGGIDLAKLVGLQDPKPKIIAPSGPTIATDPISDEVYVVRVGAKGGSTSSRVEVYDRNGNRNGEFGEGQLSSSYGIAISPISGEAYVGNGGRVDIFGQSLALPSVATGGASEISQNSATLRGEVDPVGGPGATCMFEYVDAPTFNESQFAEARRTPCSPSGPLVGTTPIAVQGLASGLSAGVEYRYRIVGSNVNGSNPGAANAFTTVQGEVAAPQQFSACSNESFRIGASAVLPDCRSYEQATSVNKNGGGAEGLPDYVKAAADGSGITFYSQAGVPGGRGAQNTPSFLANRGSTEWGTQGLLPPQAFGNLAAPIGYTSDLRYVLSEVTKVGAGTALLVEDTRTQSIQTIVPYNSGVSAPKHYSLVGASESGAKVFFEVEAPLTPGAAPEGPNLYVWDRASNTISLAGVLPGPEAAAPPAGAFGGPYDWFQHNLGRGGAAVHMYVSEVNAISASGDRAYFTARESGQLYVRQGLNGANPHTDAVSHSERTNGSGPGGRDPNGPQPAAFMMATPGGDYAFLLSSEELTNDANTGTSDEGNDLYRYEAATGRLKDMAPDPADPVGADVQGVLGISDDGNDAYFVAHGVLAQGGTLGANNLYYYRAAASPPIEFVARLSNGNLGAFATSDSINWSPASFVPSGTVGASGKTSRVSRDGSTLLFSSIRNLTGYDNLAPGCLNSPGTGPAEPCRELYRYFAPTKTLTCVSCNATGAPAVGSAKLYSIAINAFLGDAAIKTAVQTRNLSADGQRIIFETPDSLAKRDTNGSSSCRFSKEAGSCQDVYEWEAVGKGTCTAAVAVNGGCIYLLSTGQSSEPSYLGDVDSEGANVFIFTQSQLVPVDQDQLFDIYDVREGGGLASQFESPPSECVFEACQGAPPPTPSAPQPGSESLQGPGNVKHKQKGKGQKQKQVQCKQRHTKGHKCGKKRGHKPKQSKGHRKSGTGSRGAAK